MATLSLSQLTALLAFLFFPSTTNTGHNYALPLYQSATVKFLAKQITQTYAVRPRKWCDISCNKTERQTLQGPK